MDAWLEHRRSVGKPIGGEIMICDADGHELPVGELGEVWLRSQRATPSYRYVGAEARTRDGGWESLGDNGWVDADPTNAVFPSLEHVTLGWGHS